MRCRLKKIGIHFLAFFVARCQVLGMYPFVVPFFMAAYIDEQGSFSLFLVMLLGLLSNMAYISCFKYFLVIGTLLLILKTTDRQKLFSGNYMIAILAGVILWSVSMPFSYIITRENISILYSLLEGIIATCGTFVLEQGLIACYVGTNRRFATNERFIGFFCLVALFLFGIPDIHQPVFVLFVVASYLLLCYSYRFESSIGMSTGGIVGLVLALQTGKISWLAIMILLSGLIVIFRELGKVGVMLGFISGYLLLGFLYESALLNPNLLISSVCVVLLFFITPKRVLKKVNSSKDINEKMNKEFFLQEITKRRITDFGHAFVEMEKMLLLHENEITIPDDLSNVYLSGDGISLLNAVESQSNRLTEIRKSFVRQLSQIGEIITGFSGEMIEEPLLYEQFESRVAEALYRYGVVVSGAMPVKDNNGKLEAFLHCYLEKNNFVTGEMLNEVVSDVLNRNMVCIKRAGEAVTKKESTFEFVEKGKYMLTTGIVRKNRTGETKCGDSFSVSKIDELKAVLMLSDGMGCGEQANVKSEQIVELLEHLLSAGFRRELAIWLLNSFISFLSNGNISSTLDLVMIDLYDGLADFIKLGASTTFIKRNDRVECIRSTSLPVGVLEQVEFDTCGRKLYHGDMVIMISDGIMDGIIFENKETYLVDLIASINTNNVQSMAQAIMDDINSMNRGCLKDDSTVLVAGLWNC
ncbi:MAG: SpoIIE family protein phosphatase [Lachnospiraceae bacterium]